MMLSSYQELSLSLSVKEDLVEQRNLAAGRLIWIWYAFQRRRRIANSRGEELSETDVRRHRRKQRRLYAELGRVCDRLARHLRDSFSAFDIVVEHLQTLRKDIDSIVENATRSRLHVEQRLDRIEGLLSTLVEQQQQQQQQQQQALHQPPRPQHLQRQ